MAIKAFYGDDMKVNYFGKLATDGSVQVRSCLQPPTCFGAPPTHTSPALSRSLPTAHSLHSSTHSDIHLILTPTPTPTLSPTLSHSLLTAHSLHSETESQVRCEFIRTLGDWMTTLTERTVGQCRLKVIERFDDGVWFQRLTLTCYKQLS